MELLPPAKRGGDQSKSTAVDLLPLSSDQVYKLRKVYGGLPAEQLAELKAKAVESADALNIPLDVRLRRALEFPPEPVAGFGRLVDADIRPSEPMSRQQGRAAARERVQHASTSRPYAA